MRMVMLLPPSESKRPGGRGHWRPGSGRFGRRLGRQRSQLAGRLTEAMGDEEVAARLTGVAGERRRAAVAANRAMVGAPVLPAWQRYTGVVWEHLDPGSLGGEARRRAEGIAVVSALGGLFAFDDPVPDYKLKMGARLEGLGGLARWWMPALGAALGGDAAGASVVDLLPDEHRRALPADLAALRVEFRTPAGRAAGHGAKAAKGRFARHLLDLGGPVEEAAAGFAWEGWRARVAGGMVVVSRR